MTTERTVVIGVGNPYRRDDGLGPAVVSLLRSRRLPEIRLAESEGEPSELIELWAGASLAVVIDAVRTQPALPGRVHRLSAYHPVAGGSAASSHGAGLGEAVRLGRVLDRLPRRLMLFAVEAGDVEFGPGLSPPVAEAAVAVADEVAELVTAHCERKVA